MSPYEQSTAKEGVTESPTLLYVFRAFSLPAKESTIVGVNLQIKDDFVDIEGDICKEDSGKVYYRTAILRVKNDSKAVVVAARRIAEDLSRRGEELRKGIRDE